MAKKPEIIVKSFESWKELTDFLLMSETLW